MAALHISWPRFLWDSTSREFFKPAAVRTEVFNVPKDLRLSEEHLVSLSGAPRCSLVQCTGAGDAINAVVGNEELFEEPFPFTLLKASGGGWEALLHFVKVKPGLRRRGITARMFVCMARMAWPLGIRRLRSLGLHVEASTRKTNEQWSGAHVALALGWDSKLSADALKELPQSLRAVTTVQGLLGSSEGNAWWNAHPSSLELYFDTQPGSDCMRRLGAYTKSRHIRISQ